MLTPHLELYGRSKFPLLMHTGTIDILQESQWIVTGLLQMLKQELPLTNRGIVWLADQAECPADLSLHINDRLVVRIIRRRYNQSLVVIIEHTAQ